MLTFDSFSNIRNLIFSDDTGLAINLIADIDGVGKDIPFTALKSDPEPYGHDLYESALAGTYGPVAPFVPPPQDSQVILRRNTQQFNRLLIAATAVAFPLQSAVTLGVATQSDQDALAALQQYSIDLANTDLTQNPAAFPEPPAGVKLPL